MKKLFLLLLFIVGSVAVPVYHGDRRFWTVVDSDGRTKVALHVLNEPVNLIFPKDKTIARLLSDMKLLSPSGNVQCQDTTNKMGFTLLFDEHNHIRGEIKMAPDADGQKVSVAPPPPPKPRLFAVVETEQTQTETTIENGPRSELKNRSMYGEGGFEQMDEPYDYHLNEGSKFAAVKVSTPKLQQFDDFWSCIGYLSSSPKPKSPIYVNSKIGGKNVYFMIRDCVANESKYAAFGSLANRMFEPFKFKTNAREQCATSIDDENKFFVLRIFILSYDPLTMEVHCRGQVPSFLFDVFGCGHCRQIGDYLGKGFKHPPVSDCRGNWDTFVCRVKRTPMNTHQFLCVNPPGNTKAEEINHLLVIRGNKEPNELRECVRECKFRDWSHPNNFVIENDVQGGGDSTHGSEKQKILTLQTEGGGNSTLQTQGTQPSSKELKG